MSPPKRGGRKPPPSRSGGGHRRAPTTAHRAPAAARGLGGDQVEGRQAVRELLLSGRRVRELWVATDLDDASVVDEILELAREMRITVREVSRNKMAAEARTDAPQGVLAKAAPLHEVELDELAKLRHASGAKPFLIVADGVTDPGNLGALLRSASCAGATGVVLPRHRAVHITPTVAKTAAGAIEHLLDGAGRWHPERAHPAAGARGLGRGARHGRRPHPLRAGRRRSRASRARARSRGQGASLGSRGSAATWSCASHWSARSSRSTSRPQARSLATR